MLQFQTLFFVFRISPSLCVVQIGLFVFVAKTEQGGCQKFLELFDPGTSYCDKLPVVSDQFVDAGLVVGFQDKDLTRILGVHQSISVGQHDWLLNSQGVLRPCSGVNIGQGRNFRVYVVQSHGHGLDVKGRHRQATQLFQDGRCFRALGSQNSDQLVQGQLVGQEFFGATSAHVGVVSFAVGAALTGALFADAISGAPGFLGC